MSNPIKTVAIAITSVGVLVLGGAMGYATYNNLAQLGSNTQASAPVQEVRKPVERTKEETKTESIAYNTEYVEDDTLEYGKTKERTAGSNGVKTYTYRVVYLDNIEQSRELISEEVTTQPINRVVAKGTKIIWRCYDVTSYDGNPYNDNKCISSTGEVRYVCDSEAERLDPTYIAPRYGAPKYNI